MTSTSPKYSRASMDPTPSATDHSSSRAARTTESDEWRSRPPGPRRSLSTRRSVREYETVPAEREPGLDGTRLNLHGYPGTHSGGGGEATRKVGRRAGRALPVGLRASGTAGRRTQRRGARSVRDLRYPKTCAWRTVSGGDPAPYRGPWASSGSSDFQR